MRVEDLRPLEIFEGLTDEQLSELIERSDEVRLEPGEVLFHEGEKAEFWYLLVEGAIDLVRRVGREEAVIGRMEPGRWAGGLQAWDEHGVYLATTRYVGENRVLRVPSEVLKDLCETWFPFGAHLIKGLYGGARNIEATVRERESLITLGGLAAGLAHEINNPAAATARSVTALAEASGVLLSSLTSLAEGDISARQFRELDALRREVEPAGPMDALEMSDREDALTTWLEARGVERAWAIAPPLAAAGVDEQWCERVAGILEGPSLEAGLEWAASTFSAVALLGEMKESTRRISELVAAVGSYSQMDRGSIQRIDITEGLESTLTMLGHKLRDGVTVVREYDEHAPQVDVYAGELNQVWTNLIDNAVDAMEGRGTLRLATRSDGDGIVVEIADTGPDLPPEVAQRAFDAFYTTKDVGKGTGLGLDIARRIVEDRHGGQIAIAREGNETILRVRLPLKVG
jgi:signal transduction histidine kinase